MTIHRQGFGEQRPVRATPPTDRTDGTPLALTEIAHYNFYMSFDSGPVVLIGATQIQNGEFTDVIDVDAQTPGTYALSYSTVDTDGREGPLSPPLTIEILAPLAPPSPPSGIA